MSEGLAPCSRPADCMMMSHCDTAKQLREEEQTGAYKSAPVSYGGCNKLQMIV